MVFETLVTAWFCRVSTSARSTDAFSYSLAAPLGRRISIPLWSPSFSLITTRAPLAAPGRTRVWEPMRPSLHVRGRLASPGRFLWGFYALSWTAFLVVPHLRGCRLTFPEPHHGSRARRWGALRFAPRQEVGDAPLRSAPGGGRRSASLRARRWETLRFAPLHFWGVL